MEEQSQIDEMRRRIGAARARVSPSRAGLQTVDPDEPREPKAERRPPRTLSERLRSRFRRSAGA